MGSGESLGGGTAYSDQFYGDDNRNSLIGGFGDTLHSFGNGRKATLALRGSCRDKGERTILRRPLSSG